MALEIGQTVCAVCGTQQWRLNYEGPIRHGRFGAWIESKVFECLNCGVGYLPSSVSMTPDYYKGAQYREAVGETPDPEGFFKLHDAEQFHRYALLDFVPLRGRVVADVGCAAGSFLDGVRGYASVTIGVEPAMAYHESLRQRGHVVFSELASACAEWRGKVDLVVCFSVIEHVTHPVSFLQQMKDLLSAGGRMLISTPNAKDILLEVGCEPYRRFFYRSVHTYYFDSRSLRAAANRAGFSFFEPRYIHRFNFGNFVAWLGKNIPSGNVEATVLGDRFDRLWRTELESSGHADYLYAWLAE